MFRNLPKWPGWLFTLISVAYQILDFVGNLDFVVEKYNNPRWIASVPSFLLNPSRGFQIGLFVIGILWLTVVYWRRSIEQNESQTAEYGEKRNLALDNNNGIHPRLEIQFNDGKAPFEQSDRHLKLFCIGVGNRSRITLEDVSVRLERIEPNPSQVPFLEFREMVFPFADRYVKGELPVIRSVNLNPNQVRFFEIVFMYEGLKQPHIELCFFPSNYLIPAARYVLGLRATGKNVHSEYSEFEVSVTEKGQLFFERFISLPTYVLPTYV